MAKHTLKQMALNPRAHPGVPTPALAPSLYLSIVRREQAGGAADRLPRIPAGKQCLCSFNREAVPVHQKLGNSVCAPFSCLPLCSCRAARQLLASRGAAAPRHALSKSCLLSDHARKARQTIHASVLGPALPAWTRGPCTRCLDTQRYLIKVSYLTYPWSMYSMARYIKGSSQKASKNSTKLGQIPPANMAHATWRIHSKWSAWREQKMENRVGEWVGGWVGVRARERFFFH
jgi:hypothetical protein